MVEVTTRKTGFEEKGFKVVILNWLYHPEPQERICAGAELRKRLMAHNPRPDWLPEKKPDATIQNP